MLFSCVGDGSAGALLVVVAGTDVVGGGLVLAAVPTQ